MEMSIQLTNEQWNIRAVITQQADGQFEVYIEPISGPNGLEKTFVFQTEKEAFDHAETVLGL